MKSIYFVTPLFALYLSACSNFVQVVIPPNQLDAAAVFNDEAAANAAFAGIYGNMVTGALSANVQIATALAADELDNMQNDEANNQFWYNSILVDNGNLQTFWRALYDYIYDANMAIAGLEASTGLSQNVKEQLLGEAKFIRAFCYFYLVNLWGDVPLVLTTDYQVNQSLSRASLTTIYEQIFLDLNEAKSLLKPDYPTTERVRPNTFAASAFLARVYLYREQWGEAEQEANSVINNTSYQIGQPNDIFLKGSQETIWQLMSFYDYTNIGQQFVPWSTTARPSKTVSDFLLDAFSQTDQRKITWFNYNVVNGENLYYTYKYKLGLLSTTKNEYLIVFRLAEQYLIRAEARAHLNNITGIGSGLEDLNTVHLRSNAEPISISSQAELLAAIEKERQLELFSEWGHRWLDLKRTQRADAVLGALKGETWQSTDVFWPIPFAELEANPFLEQNDGY